MVVTTKNIKLTLHNGELQIDDETVKQDPSFFINYLMGAFLCMRSENHQVDRLQGIHKIIENYGYTVEAYNQIRIVYF